MIIKYFFIISICFNLIACQTKTEPRPKYLNLNSIKVSTNNCFKQLQDRSQSRIFLLAVGANTGDLTETDADIRKFSDAMQQYLQIPNGHICQHPNILKSELIAHLRYLRRVIHADDRLVIYYSGHGSQILDDNMDETDGLDEVFITYDVHGFFKDKIPTEADVLRDDDFIDLVNRLASPHILTVIDTCYAGGIYLTANDSKNTMAQARNKFYVNGQFGTQLPKQPIKIQNITYLQGRLFSSTTEGGKSWELPKKGGLFTDFFVRYLRKYPQADLTTLFQYTASAVKNYTQAQAKQIQNIQIPQMMGNTGGRFD